QPSAGTVRYFGEDVTRWPAYRRRRSGLCRTFQKVRLFESLTVAQNVGVAACENCTDGEDWREHVVKVLDRLHLTAIAGRMPSEIALADRKRVEIARAIAGRCQVLMLDESLNGLTHDEADK